MVRLSFALLVAPILALSLAGSMHAQAVPEVAPEAEAPGGAAMTPARMADILREIDPEAEAALNRIAFRLDDVPVTVIFDPRANRMRAIVPIASQDSLGADDLLRLMQANFDSALDARYAIADGRIWAVFVHPLAELDRRQLISGVAQTVALAQTYGTTYSSTGMMFRGGDSAERLRELLEPGEEL
jgi:hypothetical protein